MRNEQLLKDASSTIKIALADNQQIFRKGLSTLLNEVENVDVVLEVNNGKDLLTRIKACKPDVIILATNMPDMCGLETTKNLRKFYPPAKIIVLSDYTEKATILNLIENGAHGFLHKNYDIDQILEGIYTICKNGYYLNETISKMMFDHTIQKQAPQKNVLSKREIEIVVLLSKELKNAEIADKLFINIRTVERHRENIRIKLNAKNLSGILMYAVKHNLLA
jgi:DNA-binding NarL/FixJ family response regulator